MNVKKNYKNLPIYFHMLRVIEKQKLKFNSIRQECFAIYIYIGNETGFHRISMEEG